MCVSHNNPNHPSSELAALLRNLNDDKVLLVTNRDITTKPHVYGEDYYGYTLLTKLKENGIWIDIAIFSNNVVKFYEKNKLRNIQSIGSIIKGYDIIILFSVSPLKLLKLKFKHRFRLIMLVIFLWNRSCSVTSNVRWFLGNTLWQLVIDQYIVTSSAIVKGLKLQGIFRKIYLIPPAYECKHCDPAENAEKLKKLKKRLPQRVKMVYIGSLVPKRFSIIDAIDRFNNDKERTYELDIYTATLTEERTYKIGNVKVNVFKKILSDAEKCRVLSRSHLFIAPKRGTTMDPSISIMEAEYHGNIVIRI